MLPRPIYWPSELFLGPHSPSEGASANAMCVFRRAPRLTPLRLWLVHNTPDLAVVSAQFRSASPLIGSGECKEVRQSCGSADVFQYEGEHAGACVFCGAAPAL